MTIAPIRPDTAVSIPCPDFCDNTCDDWRDEEDGSVFHSGNLPGIIPATDAVVGSEIETTVSVNRLDTPGVPAVSEVSMMLLLPGRTVPFAHVAWTPDNARRMALRLLNGADKVDPLTSQTVPPAGTAPQVAPGATDAAGPCPPFCDPRQCERRHEKEQDGSLTEVAVHTTEKVLFGGAGDDGIPEAGVELRTMRFDLGSNTGNPVLVLNIEDQPAWWGFLSLAGARRLAVEMLNRIDAIESGDPR